MNFIRQEDQVMFDDLVDSQVFSIADFAAMKAPETGHLMDVLMANHEQVCSAAWIYWLVRQHGCIRLAKVRTDREWVDEQNFSNAQKKLMCQSAVLPFAKNRDGWLVGVARPCDRTVWAERLGREITLVAVLPSELEKLLYCYDTI